MVLLQWLRVRGVLSLASVCGRNCTRTRALVATLVLLLGTRASLAQCEPGWQPGNGLPGVSGSIQVNASILWDPDSAGPQDPLLVLAGGFSVVVEQGPLGQSVSIGNLVAWDGRRFIPLVPEGTAINTGLFGSINALAVLPDNSLVIAGSFTNAAGVTATNIARWDGTTWTPMGDGLGARVNALTLLPNGDLLAAGIFTTSGLNNVTSVARWNGSAWTPYAPTSPNNINTILVVNNEVVVGGSFSSTGITGLARWNGSAWVGYPTGVYSVNALCPVPGSTTQFYAAGSFTDFTGNGLTGVARWTGSSWAPLGAGLGSGGGAIVNAIAASPNGNVYCGGTFSGAPAQNGHPAVLVQGIAMWDGTLWNTLQQGVGGTTNTILAPADDRIIVAGQSSSFGPYIAGGVAEWNGTQWSVLGQGNGGVYAMVEAPGGDVYAAGAFTVSGGVNCYRVARWDGERWNALATGTNNLCNAIARLNNGDIVVGGTFNMLSGVAPMTPAGRIAKWNGTSWDTMGGGITANGTAVNALAVRSNGDLIVGGNFNSISGVAAVGLARWNETLGWAALNTNPAGTINAILPLPNGDLIVAGGFSTIGGIAAGNIARWSELSGWSPLMSGTQNGPNGTVYGLALASNGDILAAGDFTQISPTTIRSRVSRYNGTTWTPLGNESISGVALAYAVLERPDGTIIAGGNFTTMTGANANYIARWTGAAWEPLQDGMNTHVRTLLNHSSGELWAGGLFNFANRIPAVGWARWKDCNAVNPCVADFDDGNNTGTPDGAVTIDDLLYFVQVFAVGDIEGDIDDGNGTAVPDGAVTIDDLLYYIVRFADGC